MAPIQRIQLPPTLSLTEYSRVILRKKKQIHNILSQLSDQPIHSNRIGYFQTKLEHLTKLEDRVQNVLRRNCNYISEASFETYTYEFEPLDFALQTNVLDLKKKLDEKVSIYIDTCKRLEEKREKFKKQLTEENKSCEKENIEIQKEIQEKDQLKKTIETILDSKQSQISEEGNNSIDSLDFSDLEKLKSDMTKKIDTSVKESDEIVRRMKNTIRMVGEKRIREESLLKSPQQNRSVKKLRLC